jgi:hypothetical protein
MKRNIFLGAIAIAAAVAGYLIPAVIVLLIVAIFNFIQHRRGANINEAPKPSEMTVDELTAQYGEPEDVILLNAARANEALGVILAYKDFLVVEGRRINKSDITDVTFNNSGTPYAPGEYQVIIATSGQGFLHVNTGYDANWTKDVTEEIKNNL